MKGFRILVGFLMLSFLMFCKEEKTSDKISSKETPKDSAIVKKEEPPKPTVQYSSLIFPEKKKDSVMKIFNEKYSKEEQYVILALNRLDIKNKWRADTLMIPSVIDSSLMAYSPFPYQLDVLKDVNKFVTFSYPIQAYAVYSNGKLEKWGPTSMGKKAAQTKTGLMFANWKKELATSTVNSSWKLPYNFNIHNTLGIGWHQYELPGYPASHSCLRLLMDDAKWMYNYADTWILNKGGATVRANGTPVIVFGDYAWGQKKPWKSLSENAKATDISVQQMNEIIQPHIEKILQEQKNRETVAAEVKAEKEKIITTSDKLPEKSTG